MQADLLEIPKFKKGKTYMKWFIGIVFIVFCLGIGFFACDNYSDNIEHAKQNVIDGTDIEKLKELSEKFSKKAMESKAKALKLAKEKGWIIRKEFKDGKVIELQGVDENGQPIYNTTFKNNIRK